MTSTALSPTPATRVQRVCLVLIVLAVTLAYINLRTSQGSLIEELAQQGESNSSNITTVTLPLSSDDILPRPKAAPPATVAGVIGGGAAEGAPLLVKTVASSKRHQRDLPPIITLSWLLPAKHVYRSSNPFHVAEYTLASIQELAARRPWSKVIASSRNGNNSSSISSNTPSGNSNGNAHLVIKLPNADFASDLRPLTRLLACLSVMLAIEEETGAMSSSSSSSSSVVTSFFQQFHFIAPINSPALLRGDGVSSSSSIASTSIGKAASSTTTTTGPAALATTTVKATTTGAPAAEVEAEDEDGFKYRQWSLDLQRQSPLELFTLPYADSREENEKEEEDVLAAVLNTHRKKSHRQGRHFKVYDFGSFGREGGRWEDMWALDKHDRTARLRRLALQVCKINITEEESQAAAAAAAAAGAGENEQEAAIQRTEPFKVVIYNRDMSRRLRHAHNVTMELQSRLPPGSRVTLIVHRDDRPICEVARALADADALITPHGFTSTLLMFLPVRALLVEIMPYHFHFPAYGKLSGAFGLDYMHVNSEPVRKLQPALLDIIAPLFLPGHDPRKCKDFSFCRFLAKQFPVRLDSEQISLIVQRITEVAGRRRQERERNRPRMRRGSVSDQ